MELFTPALRVMLAVSCEEETTTTAIARRIGLSQQSVSRVLASLAGEGLVEKRFGRRGLCVCLTAEGWRALADAEQRLRGALDREAAVLPGIVETGLGEGRYYVSQAGYREHFTRLLGAEAFPGTLNLRVDPLARERFLVTLPLTLIPGFRARGRSYGAVEYYPVRVRGHDCGLIMPRRRVNGHPKVELISPRELRQAFQLADGDELVIERRPRA